MEHSMSSLPNDVVSADSKNRMVCISFGLIRILIWLLELEVVV